LIVGSFGNQDLAHRAFVGGFDFHRRFVGLDLGDDVARLDAVALFLEPLGQIALFHRGRERRHEYIDRHGRYGFLRGSFLVVGSK
jgi:hypothetical protein